jgi:hypothetical protein
MFNHRIRDGNGARSLHSSDDVVEELILGSYTARILQVRVVSRIRIREGYVADTYPRSIRFLFNLINYRYVAYLSIYHIIWTYDDLPEL